MFLKRIELQGFKSFADKTILQFDHPVTGIVGPNGCGKSNVNDAIRWVLGEQSAKSLRSGAGMSDIIFSGSQSRKAVNMAKVSLVFDNTQRIFPIDFDEVEISRQLQRPGEASYSINKTPCRLKDINDLVMDTGLGKDSLSIITQGNISSFADARPEDRRLLFEEAAGVAKYKKRKKVSLSKLEHTMENLERLQDLIDELEKRLPPLEKQAQKAETFRKLQEELKEIEISVLADEIEGFQKQIDQLNAYMAASTIEEQQSQKLLDECDQQAAELRKQMYAMDGELAQISQKKNRMMEKSFLLEKRKVELDEKRKYQLAAGDEEEQAAQLEKLLAEAQFEMEDRQRRLDEMQKKAAMEEEEISALLAEKSMLDQACSQAQRQYTQTESRIRYLEQVVRAPFAHQQSVKAVMDAKELLSGIEGVVMELLTPKSGMAGAINAALGGAIWNIAAADEKAARNAIAYLKKSRAGRATFIPLNVCRPRTVSAVFKNAVENLPGKIGWAKDLADCHPRYQTLKESLLGNIFVTETLENANLAAKTMQYSVKVVTLDGDIVHAGGNMTGGSMKSQNGYLLSRQELESLQPQLQKKGVILEKSRKQCTRLEGQLEEKTQALTDTKIECAKLENLCAAKTEKYQSLLGQYQSLGRQGKVLELDSSDLSLVQELARVHEQIDEINARYDSLSRQRQQTGLSCQEKEETIRQERRSLSALTAQLHKADLEMVEASTRMESSLMRLNQDYQMTFEAAFAQKKELNMEQAREDVKTLRSSIKALGNVNLEAPEEYRNVKERCTFLNTQKEDLLKAREQILGSIQEMDTTMSSQFLEMFQKINEQLTGVFQAMFGGGKARLFLVDPEDILNTGIDIEVQPPGKMVRSLQSFSGGEKALIAISVLFSILKARTMPLCIFDEVEAALDQANVERFARYLSSFKDTSQFIVVTHRPGTMEQCDALYGVTMEQNGVSTILNVKLKDAFEYAESEVKA